jgi:large subunit ribosomal protein L6
VKDGFERKLEINGVGYRAAMQGQNLQLALGFSHDVVYQLPKGVEINAEADGNRHFRHRQAARRPGCRRNPRIASPEPYKGKGIKYARRTSSARKARRSKEGPR